MAAALLPSDRQDSAAHFGAVRTQRGPLRAPRLNLFLSSDMAPRLRKAVAGIDPIEMVET
jgi:hypothetical protein